MSFLTQELQTKILNQVLDEGEPKLYVPPVQQLPGGVPGAWRNMLENEHSRKYLLKTVWAIVEAKLPRTTTAMEKTLQGICLLTSKAVPARLLYFFNYDSYTFVFCGGAPNVRLSSDSNNLPEYFLDFYKVHDGWTLFFRPESGPFSSDNWFLLETYENRDLVQIAKKYLDPNKFLVVSELAADGCLGFDLTTKPATPYVCWENFPVEILPDVWRKFDDEIGEFLEQMDPV